MRLFATLMAAAVAVLLSTPAWAQHGDVKSLVVGVQESGTVQWEIETIKSLGLDKKHGLTLEVRPVADSPAGQIALQAGEVDVILSDFVWVTMQRGEGNKVTMVPHSRAVGGLMVPEGSDITKVEDLKGHTIAVAGGPMDKSWVTLQAYYNSVTGAKLVDDVTANYGAPPLVNELLGNGGADAALNYWQWNARSKVTGSTELLSVADMLEALGVSEQPPLLGWTFTDETGKEKKAAITAFLDASFEAKDALLNDDEVWTGLQTLMGADGDEALFMRLRDDYRAGIVTSYNPTKMAAAKEAFALMAEFGGSELVGEKSTLDANTFWRGYRK